MRREVRFEKDAGYSVGRNGVVHTHGIEATEFSDRDHDRIILNPITSRGYTDNCRISIAADKLGDVIRMLQEIELARRVRQTLWEMEEGDVHTWPNGIFVQRDGLDWKVGCNSPEPCSTAVEQIVRAWGPIS